jgi:hypothetical protein
MTTGSTSLWLRRSLLPGLPGGLLWVVGLGGDAAVSDGHRPEPAVGVNTCYPVRWWNVPRMLSLFLTPHNRAQ